MIFLEHHKQAKREVDREGTFPSTGEWTGTAAPTPSARRGARFVSNR
jgi:hypothetical protein